MSDQRVPMTIDEQKTVMLNILIRFADFCQENNLQYFLDAGTLLGAVRHKGYIPWDDDIDVNMPRTDYDRFCDLVRQNGGYMDEHLVVEFPEDTIYPFLKIGDDRTILIEFPQRNPMEVKVYIDVFPKDGIVDLNLSSKILCKTNEILRLMQWFNTYSIYAWKRSTNPIKKTVAAIGRRWIKNPSRPIRLQHKLIARHNRNHPLEKCQYVTTLVNGEFYRCAPKKCFEQSIMMEFEGRMFSAPGDYDTYLSVLYSKSYMQPPPLEKQVKHHNTNAFWINAAAAEEFEL